MSFESVPDAPVSKFIVEMQGGKKGLFVNSRDLCKGAQKATVKFTAHNGKTYEDRIAVKATGCKRKGTTGPKRSHRGPR